MNNLDQKIQKAKKAGVPDDVIMQYVKQKYPDYGKKSLPGLLDNVVKNSKSFTGIPGNINQQAKEAFSTGDPRDASNFIQSFQPHNQAINMGKGLAGQVGEIIKQGPVDYAYNQPIDALLLALGGKKFGVPAAKGTIKTTAKATKTVAHPKQIVNTATETRAKKAGTFSDEKMNEFFGTFEKPLPKLFEGVAGAGEESKLLDIIKRERALFESSGAETGKTYSKALDNRKGLYNESKIRSKDQKYMTPEQQVKFNLAKQYSELLKEGAGTGNLDKMYSLLSKMESGVGKAKWGAERAIYTGLGIAIAKKLGLF